MRNYFSSLPYPKFKLAIVALLALNAVIYAVADTLTSAVDAWAWLDVYDAALWIVAFASIEVDIFQLFQRKQA